MKYSILSIALAITLLSYHATKANDNFSTKSKSIQLVIDNNPTEEMINFYLQLKNALTVDDSKGAASAAGNLKSALINLGKQSMQNSQKKLYQDVADDAIENTQHIADNGGNIKHQREHFENLSNDIYDLVKAFGASQILYKNYCPMKKASWLSEIKEIKNPYFGKSMLTCGSIKETINKK